MAKNIQEDGNVYTPPPPRGVNSFTQHWAAGLFRSRLQIGLSPSAMLSVVATSQSWTLQLGGLERSSVMAGNEGLPKAGLCVCACKVTLHCGSSAASWDG